jgi:hypothetical protein
VGLKRSLVGIGAALARMDAVRDKESHVTLRDAPRLVLSPTTRFAARLRVGSCCPNEQAQLQ